MTWLGLGWGIACLLVGYWLRGLEARDDDNPDNGRIRALKKLAR